MDDRSAAHCVAHVGFRVVHDSGVRRFQKLHLRLVDMHAVDRKRFIAENARIEEPRDDALAVLVERILQIPRSLGAVDVEARFLSAVRKAVLKRLFGERERRVQAHHALLHIAVVFRRFFDEALVFEDRLHALFLAVAIGNLVTERGAHAEFLCGCMDLVQGARNVEKACVVVEHGRHAVFDAVGVDRFCGPVIVFLGEAAVDLPPHAL